MVWTTLDYDVDQNTHPASVVVTVTLSDQQLKTATASLTILFLDCNDNAPEVSVAV